MDKEKIMSFIKVGDVFSNPRRGTSEIVNITDYSISYKRGSSIMSLPIDVLNSVLSDFSGKRCSSTDLQKYKPYIFSTHTCNCSFIFSLTEKMGLLENGIQGRGVSGDPFYVNFK